MHSYDARNNRVSSSVKHLRTRRWLKGCGWPDGLDLAIGNDYSLVFCCRCARSIDDPDVLQCEDRNVENYEGGHVGGALCLSECRRSNQ